MSGQRRWMDIHDAWMRAKTPQERARIARDNHRTREEFDRELWLHRVRIWLEGEAMWADVTGTGPRPIAPDGCPTEWRWANWKAFSEQDVFNVAMIRTSGCACRPPLIGWWEGGVRCRMCNTRAEYKATDWVLGFREERGG